MRSLYRRAIAGSEVGLHAGALRTATQTRRPRAINLSRKQAGLFVYEQGRRVDEPLVLNDFSILYAPADHEIEGYLGQRGLVDHIDPKETPGDFVFRNDFASRQRSQDVVGLNFAHQSLDPFSPPVFPAEPEESFHGRGRLPDHIVAHRIVERLEVRLLDRLHDKSEELVRSHFSIVPTNARFRMVPLGQLKYSGIAPAASQKPL